MNLGLMYVSLSLVAIPCTLLVLGSLIFCHFGVLLAAVLQISGDLTTMPDYIRGVGNLSADLFTKL